MTNYERMAEILVDEIVEDGRLHRPRRCRKIIERALRRAYADGLEAGQLVKEREVAEAAGLVHGFACVKGKELLASLRQLASGGRVKVIVGDAPETPRLRLAGEVRA